MHPCAGKQTCIFNLTTDCIQAQFRFAWLTFDSYFCELEKISYGKCAVSSLISIIKAIKIELFLVLQG